MESIGLGLISITSGRLVISDPSYERNIWCASAIENFPNGQYDCEIDLGEAIDWGTRVFRMRMLKEGLNLSQCDFKLLDSCCVDCAILGFFDDDYHKRSHPNKVSDEWFEQNIIGLVEFASIPDEKCFLSSTGIGDGQYNVYGLYDCDGNLVGVEAEFLSDEDEA